jgi:hypothetical protein
VQLQPRLELPLRGRVGGNVSWPEVVFNRAGDRCIVADFYQKFGSVTNLRWHAPDFAALLLVIVMVWVGKRALGMWMRRGEAGMAGRWVCRKCGYDLTPHGASLVGVAMPVGVAGVCAECGVSTAVMRPRRVRSRARLMAAPIGALVLSVLGAGGVFWWSLELAPPAVNPEEVWPSPWLSRGMAWVGIPVLERAGLIAGECDTHTLTVYELPSGRVVQRVDGMRGGQGQYSLTGDEDWCVGRMSTLHEPSFISAVDLRADPPRVCRWPLPGGQTCWIAPGMIESHAVLLEELARADRLPWWTADGQYSPPTRDIVIRAWRIDLESGRATRDLELPVRLDEPATRRKLSLSLWPSGAGPGSYTVVLQTAGWGYPGAEPAALRVFHCTPEAVTTVSAQHTAAANVSDRPEPDGVTVMLHNSANWQSAVALDTRTGIITTPPLPTITDLPNGLHMLNTGVNPQTFCDGRGVPIAQVYYRSYMYQAYSEESGHWAYSVWHDAGAGAPAWVTNLVGYRFPLVEAVPLWDLGEVKRAMQDAEAPAPSP